MTTVPAPAAQQPLGLANRLALAGEQAGFVIVGQKYVSVGQHWREAAPIVGRLGHHHVQHGGHAGCTCLTKEIGQAGGFKSGHHQIASDVKHFALAHQIDRDALRREKIVGRGSMNETTIFAGHVDDQRGAGVGAVERDHVAGVGARLGQRIGKKLPKRIAPHAAQHAHRHAQPGQIGGDIRRAAADRQRQPLGQGQLTRCR